LQFAPVRLCVFWLLALDAASCLLTNEHMFDALRGGAVGSNPSALPSGRGSQSDRHTDRISVTGWAQVLQSNQVPWNARMNELSSTGFSLFLDFQLWLSESYHLKINIFRHGAAHTFEVHADCVYATLVRTNGFKHGFRFKVLDAAAEDAIRAILD
jgi:hypothetical protein